MVHPIETMAYAGTTPWHGLGNHRNNLSRSGSVKPVWTGKSRKAPFTSSQMLSVTWARSIPFQSRRCSTDQTPRHRCPWSRSATTPCNRARYWSSIGISPRSQVTSWKRPEYSRAVASSGRWRALGKRLRRKVTTRLTVTCNWPRPATFLSSQSSLMVTPCRSI
jgi:hypothetical protein